jgi:hypothetical protein
MQCSCGGSTREHDVQRGGRIVAGYRRCTACGRVDWLTGRERVQEPDGGANQGQLLPARSVPKAGDWQSRIAVTLAKQDPPPYIWIAEPDGAGNFVLAVGIHGIGSVELTIDREEYDVWRLLQIIANPATNSRTSP